MKRRDSLRLINSFVMSLGVTSLRKWTVDTSVMQQNDIIAFAKNNGIRSIADKLCEDKYAKDFGNFYKAIPQAGLLPDSTEQSKSILDFAKAKKIPLVPRGAGHSQSGQSLITKNGIPVDLRELNKIGGLETNQQGNVTITCSPGTTLRQSVSYTHLRAHETP